VTFRRAAPEGVHSRPTGSGSLPTARAPTRVRPYAACSAVARPACRTQPVRPVPPVRARVAGSTRWEAEDSTLTQGGRQLRLSAGGVAEEQHVRAVGHAIRTGNVLCNCSARTGTSTRSKRPPATGSLTDGTGNTERSPDCASSNISPWVCRSTRRGPRAGRRTSCPLQQLAGIHAPDHTSAEHRDPQQLSSPRSNTTGGDSQLRRGHTGTDPPGSARLLTACSDITTHRRSTVPCLPLDSQRRVFDDGTARWEVDDVQAV
jgi:hypothetical protein